MRCAQKIYVLDGSINLYKIFKKNMISKIIKIIKLSYKRQTLLKYYLQQCLSYIE